MMEYEIRHIFARSLAIQSSYWAHLQMMSAKKCLPAPSPLPSGQVVIISFKILSSDFIPLQHSPPPPRRSPFPLLNVPPLPLPIPPLPLPHVSSSLLTIFRHFVSNVTFLPTSSCSSFIPTIPSHP